MEPRREQNLTEQEVQLCRPCEQKAREQALISGGDYVPGQSREYSVGDKIKNLGKGIKGMVKQDYVDNLVYLERKEICRKCPHRLNVITQKFEPRAVSKSCKCTVCDCFLITKVGMLRGKLWLRNQGCPLGKWSEISL